MRRQVQDVKPKARNLEKMRVSDNNIERWMERVKGSGWRMKEGGVKEEKQKEGERRKKMKKRQDTGKDAKGEKLELLVLNRKRRDIAHVEALDVGGRNSIST